MSSTQKSSESITSIPSAASVDLKLEVVILPVADVDRAKRFYQGLGWRLDADFGNADGWRVVQLTPPGSPCSIQFGNGVTAAPPGSVKGTFLVVDDIKAARGDLIAHGVNVSEVFHFEGDHRPAGGPDPDGRSYNSFATFSDPDGNGWLLQEIKTRLPGRGFGVDVATMTGLLKEAEQRHGVYGPTAPKHHWSDWYAAYVVARENGRTPEEAAADGAAHTEAAIRQGGPERRPDGISH